MYAHTIVHTTHAYPFCVASRWCTFGFGTTTTGSSTKCWKQWCKKRWIFLLSAVTNFTNRSPTRWHTNDVNLCILRKIEMCAFDMHTCYMWLDALDTNESVGEYKTYARVHLLRSLPWIAAPIPPHSLTTHPHYTHTQVKKEKGGMELIAYNPPLKHNIWRQDHPEVRPNAHTHTLTWIWHSRIDSLQSSCATTRLLTGWFWSSPGFALPFLRICVGNGSTCFTYTWKSYHIPDMYYMYICVLVSTHWYTHVCIHCKYYVVSIHLYTHVCIHTYVFT